MLPVALLCGAGSFAAAQEPLVVRKVAFEGNRAIDDLTLAAAIQTTSSSFFATFWPVRWLGLGERRRFNERDFERDVERIAVLYRASGFLEVRVDTVVRRTEESASITFRIEEGPPVLLTDIVIGGLDELPIGAGRRARLLRDLPLGVGDAFNRLRLGALADTLATRLRDLGYPAATVGLVRRVMDSAARTAAVELEVRPGRPAVFGRITVEGVGGADSAFVGNLLAARPGRTYRISDVLRSQRNLALTDLYRFASVEIDTARILERAPAGTTLDSVPLLVRVVPMARHRVAASAGYGTDDCFRTSAAYGIRNALAPGQAVELVGRVSKLGVGAPFDWGLADGFPCGRLAQDSVGSGKLNYTATLSLRRPALLSPANSATLTAFAERRSEFAVYRREEYGASLTLTRETGRRIPVTLGYRLAYGVTTATDVSFCAFFNACTPDDIGVLKERQRQGVVSLGVTSLRLNNLLDPTRGSSVGLQMAHSARYTGSEPLQRFSRAVADAALYRPLGGQLVAALRIRGGVLLSPAGPGGAGPVRFVPPEQRFYAGGPLDVRGFDRNELGPVVYVILDRNLGAGPDDPIPADQVSVAPVGGNRSLIANAELRLPSPFLAPRTRLVAFVDGGSVWEAGGDAGVAERFRFRVTPGLGVRVATPLGPARLDVAYNGYRRVAGPLYAAKEDGSLELLRAHYVPPRRSPLTVHFGIGQAF
jgi:outer membrane protein assembly factor BamA